MASVVVVVVVVVLKKVNPDSSLSLRLVFDLRGTNCVLIITYLKETTTNFSQS